MQDVSFILLSPLLGYKLQNKKYLKLELVKENIEIIYKNFKKPDIILVTGFYTEEYEKIKNNHFRICENQNFNSSGELEQIRLGINNAIHSHFVILKEDCLFDPTSIKRALSNKENFILNGTKKSNPGMIIEDDMVYNISFGLENYFGDFLYLHDLTRKIKKFIKHEANINKTLHELVNFIIEKKPIKYYENTDFDRLR